MSASRFRFTLDRLLALRERALRDAAVALAGAQSQAKAAHDALDEIARARDAAGAMGTPHASDTPLAQIRPAAVLHEALARHEEAARVTAAEHDAAAAERLSHVHARTRDARVLERLRDRQFTTWLVADARIDRETMDAIGRSRFLDAKTRASTDPGA